MKTPNKNILGLSHLFGEGRNILASIEILQTNGFKLEFDGNFPVGTTKRDNLLHNKSCTTAQMFYLSAKETIPFGIEYLDHHSFQKQDSSRRISISAQSKSEIRITDADGNMIHLSPQNSKTTKLSVPVFKAQIAKQILESLGFIKITENLLIHYHLYFYY